MRKDPGKHSDTNVKIWELSQTNCKFVSLSCFNLYAPQLLLRKSLLVDWKIVCRNSDYDSNLRQNFIVCQITQTNTIVGDNMSLATIRAKRQDTRLFYNFTDLKIATYIGEHNCKRGIFKNCDDESQYFKSKGTYVNSCYNYHTTQFDIFGEHQQWSRVLVETPSHLALV